MLGRVAMKTARSLLCLAAGLLLASCVAHGQNQPREFLQTMPAELSELPYWKVFRNHSSHSERFFKNLTFGRVFVHKRSRAPGVAIAMLVRDDGEIFLCNSPYGAGTAHRLNRKKLSFETHSTGATWTVTDKLGDAATRLVFYDPGSGAFHTEGLLRHPDPHKRRRVTLRSGWVQDSWPRAMADKCPKLELPANMRVNEKQTSLRMDKLRRQDPDAPLRDFPGSQLTAPGRTGLTASGGKPTTTVEEVNAFLAAQESNIVKWVSPGYTYVRSGDREEFWRLQNASRAEKFFDIVRSEDGKWMTIGEITYPIGYPFPYLPTGHRHPAFQLTDEFLARPYPRSLPHMGEAYADKRFVFHPKGKFSVVDEAGNLVEGPHFDGVWRWTKGRLEMTVRDDPTGPRRVHWRTLAHRLGMKPKIWSPYSRDVGGW